MTTGYASFLKWHGPEKNASKKVQHSLPQRSNLNFHDILVKYQTALTVFSEWQQCTSESKCGQLQGKTQVMCGWEVLGKGENWNYKEEIFLGNKWCVSTVYKIENAETWRYVASQRQPPSTEGTEKKMQAYIKHLFRARGLWVLTTTGWRESITVPLYKNRRLTEIK